MAHKYPMWIPNIEVEDIWTPIASYYDKNYFIDPSSCYVEKGILLNKTFFIFKTEDRKTPQDFTISLGIASKASLVMNQIEILRIAYFSDNKYNSQSYGLPEQFKGGNCPYKQLMNFAKKEAVYNRRNTIMYGGDYVEDYLRHIEECDYALDINALFAGFSLKDKDEF